MKIDQFLPTLSTKDAIGNEALLIRSILKKWGHKSSIFAERYGHRAKRYFNHFNTHKNSDILIYHHSIGCQISEYVKQAKGIKVLIYHNVTPDHLLWQTNLTLANLTSQGRRQLQELRSCFDLTLADSEYNRKELQEAGYKNIHIAPLLIDFKNYTLAPDKQILKKYTNKNYKNLLFVGKIAPHKAQNDTVKTFYYYHKYINPKSRLFLIGNSDGFESYIEYLAKLIKQLDLEKAIIISSAVSQKKLISYYMIADVFICMSKHEGFCVPLIESMHFKIPIIAYSSTAVPWTLKECSVLFKTKNHLEIAELIHYVISDKTLQDKIINNQLIRLEYFKLQSTASRFKELLETML